MKTTINSIVAVLLIIATSCGGENKPVHEVQIDNTTSSDSIQNDLIEFINHLDSNVLFQISDGSDLQSIYPLEESFAGVLEHKISRANCGQSYQFVLKRGLLHKAYFELYYDTTKTQEMNKDTDIAIQTMKSLLGDSAVVYESKDLYSLTWEKENYLLDLLIYPDGYSIEGRSKPSKQFKSLFRDANKLIQYVRNGDIKIGETNSTKLREIFNIHESKELRVSSHYNNEIMTSGNFDMKGEVLSKAIFDFTYSKVQLQQIETDVDMIKESIKEVYGRTVPFQEPGQHGYRWTYEGNTLEIIIYEDGLSFAISYS